MQKMSERRLKENEVIFRSVNESVAEYVEEQVGGNGALLSFYCECSRPECQEHVTLTTKQYKDIHKNRRRFIILPGHESPQVEVIAKKEKGYDIVEKTGKMPDKQAVEATLPQMAN